MSILAFNRALLLRFVDFKFDGGGGHAGLLLGARSVVNDVSRNNLLLDLGLRLGPA